MGRVNVLNSLLNKDLIPTNLIGWIRKLLAKSWYNDGDIRFSLIALLSMFTKSGKMPYNVLLGALIAKNNKVPKRLTAKNLLGVTNLGYIESLLGSIVRGVSIPLVSKDVITYEETFFKNQAFSQVNTFLEKVNTRDFHRVALQLIHAIFPRELLDKFLPDNYNDYLSKDYSEIDQCVSLVLRLLRSSVKRRLEKDLHELTKAVQKVPNSNGTTEAQRAHLVLPTYFISIEH